VDAGEAEHRHPHQAVGVPDDVVVAIEVQARDQGQAVLAGGRPGGTAEQVGGAGEGQLVDLDVLLQGLPQRRAELVAARVSGNEEEAHAPAMSKGRASDQRR
jgi:hypothetical protein